MIVKYNNEFFEKIKDASFLELIKRFWDCQDQLSILLEKCENQHKKGDRYNVSMHRSIRKLSVAIAKFGVIFRKKSLSIEKGKKNELNQF